MKSSNQRQIRQNANIHLRRLRRGAADGNLKKTEVDYVI